MNNRKPNRVLQFESMEARRVLATTINLDSISAIDGTIISGKPGTRSGYDVSSVGDFNGDGYDDTIVSALIDGIPGEVYVVFGRSVPLATTNLSSLGTRGIAIKGTSGTGYSVSGAGDVNGDGLDDILLGRSPGNAFLLFGSKTATSTINLDNLGNRGLAFIPEATDDDMKVSGAGDVNNDGLDDMIINDESLGKAYIVYGKSTFPFDTASSKYLDFPLANLSTGNRGATIIAEPNRGFHGSFRSVASAGDMNGDGFDDIALGSPYGGPANKLNSGISYLIYGGKTLPGTINLSAPPVGMGGVRFSGIDAYDTSGMGVSGVGDVNGDGFEDMLIGAPYASGRTNQSNIPGEAYLILGKAASATTFTSQSLSTAGTILYGATASDGIGYRTSAAGDVNGDGFDDMLIGQYREGHSMVLFGAASFPATMDLNASFNGLILVNSSAQYNATNLANAGDVNGDGFDDIIVGAYDVGPVSATGTATGRSYILLGRDFSSAVTLPGTSANNVLNGSNLKNVAVAGRGNDVIHGQGGPDILIGGQGNDTIGVGSVSFKRVVGGSGTDTLALEGSGLSLNLSAIPDTRVKGIEQIDITGTGNNNLTLNLREVLNISDESNVLVVKRNAGDNVNKGAGWTTSGTETISGLVFDVFKQGNATLKIQQVSAASAMAYFDSVDTALADLTNLKKRR